MCGRHPDGLPTEPRSEPQPGPTESGAAPPTTSEPGTEPQSFSADSQDLSGSFLGNGRPETVPPGGRSTPEGTTVARDACNFGFNHARQG